MEIIEKTSAENGGKQDNKSNGHHIQNGKLPSDTEYKMYPARWFMLFVISFQNITNAMMWITFAAAADTTIAYYDITSFELNMLSIVFMIATIPFGFLASWVLDTLGLRTSLIVSAWLTGLGGLLRNMSTLDVVPRHHAYAVLITGQSLAACAQPFILFAPTKLAALWFAENRRATANMIGSIMNPLGNMLAFIIVPLIVETPDDIPLALWVVSIPAFIITLITTFGVRRSRPPTPPSPSAGETSEPFMTGLKQILFNKDYMVLNLAFGGGLGVFTAISALLEQILCPRGYSDDFAGLCGALMIVSGIVLSGIAGVYVDRTKRFDEVLKLSFGIASLAAIAFTQVSRLRDQHILVAVSLAVFGGFGLTVYPITLELAVEVTYPVAEATSSGLCIVMGQLQGIVFMFAMQYLTQPLPSQEEILKTGCHVAEGNATAIFEPEDWTNSNLYINNMVLTVSLIALVLFFKPKYKRLTAELKTIKAVKYADQIVSVNAEEQNGSEISTYM